MSLNLPKPVNTYAGQDELRNTTNGHSNGMEEEAEYRAPRMSDRYKSTMIYPPKEMRSRSFFALHLHPHPHMHNCHHESENFRRQAVACFPPERSLTDNQM